jgi:hypothetical protein
MINVLLSTSHILMTTTDQRKSLSEFKKCYKEWLVALHHLVDSVCVVSKDTKELCKVSYILNEEAKVFKSMRP